ncbi:hypothetical protein VNO80_24708 [Phaseolus coccineus]|uniref:Uncharacterized protein n=1 Tax=Phaseolus coccineus TaxID=3886 RepID=A0AAN9LWG7_PHACN
MLFLLAGVVLPNDEAPQSIIMATVGDRALILIFFLCSSGLAEVSCFGILRYHLSVLTDQTGSSLYSAFSGAAENLCV